MLKLGLTLALDPEPPSRGVVACDGHGNGCVIWCSPDSQLEFEIAEISSELGRANKHTIFSGRGGTGRGLALRGKG